MKKLYTAIFLSSIMLCGFINIAKAETLPDYTPVIKVNVDNPNKSDIYLQNPQTPQQKYFMTLSGVARDHYHPAEYHNGNLYIIKDINGHGFELWRYNSKKEGKKLYAGNNIDFRVAPDEKLVAIINNTDNITNNLILMKKDGVIIKKINRTADLLKLKDLPKDYQTGTLYLNFNSNSLKLDWDKRYIWLYNVMGPQHLGLVKIDSQSSNIKKYPLYNLNIGREVAFNIFTEKLAYSNYPIIFDVEGQQDYDKSGKQDTLFVYDLKKKTNTSIATFVTRKFDPKWISKNILETNKPYGEGRMQFVIN